MEQNLEHQGKMLKKMDMVGSRGYMKSGPVVSLTSYFAVDKDVTDI